MTKHLFPAIFATLFLGLMLTAGDDDAKRDEAWVAKRVQQIKESDTTEWRKVPWVASLLDARRVSGEEKKPIFLFTHDGNIETGRC